MRRQGNPIAAEMGAARALGEADLWWLMTRALGLRWIAQHPHADWAHARIREVEAAPDGHLDLWARGHLKTSIITVARTIQDILRDPEITVGIFSHTRPIAKGPLRQIKREFESNSYLKAVFPHVLWQRPETEAPTWSEDAGIIVRRQGNPREATVEAWGLVDGQPTGRHFRLRVYDDVVTRESVTTADQIRKTTEAFELSDNLGTADGLVRVVGTRYHVGDTYQTLIDRGAVRPRIHAATHDATYEGRPVWLSDAAWAKVKRNQSRSTIAAQQLLDPLAAGQATFQAQWLKSYEVRPATLNVVIVCDPAMGPRAKGGDTDSTAIAVLGIASGGARYLLDGMCHRMGLSDRWTALRDLQRHWSRQPGVIAVRVGYERYGMQSDLEYFEERMRIEKAWFAVDELSWPREGQHSKDARIERLEPHFRTGRFFLPALTLDDDGEVARWRVEGGRRIATYRHLRPDGNGGIVQPIESEAMRRAPHLAVKPIRRIDDERRVYDLTRRFIEQLLSHPAGAHDDLIDAVSRMEDMDPAEPVAFTPADRDGGPRREFVDA